MKKAFLFLMLITCLTLGGSLFTTSTLAAGQKTCHCEECKPECTSTPKEETCHCEKCKDEKEAEGDWKVELLMLGLLVCITVIFILMLLLWTTLNME